MNGKRLSGIFSQPHLLWLWLIWVTVAVRLVAAEPYLTDGRPDGIALLPPPPAPNSAEQKADLSSVRAVFKQAGRKQKESAETRATLTIFRFQSAIGAFFEQGKLPITEAFFDRVKESARKPIDASKRHWQRMRPYHLDPKLNHGKGEPSFSYPSGHSTVGMVQALVLAELCPQRREAILEIGRAIGWDRVIIGKHYPTDIHAGRTLAQAIVHELKANREFQRDLAEARAELEAARQALEKQQPR